MGEAVLDQMMPSPDEAPLTDCPHCGAEFNTLVDEREEHYEEVPGMCGIYRHTACGGLCRFIPTGADSEIE